MNKIQNQTCTNCVMDTTDPNITFNEKGVCDRCSQFYKEILPSWNYGKDKEAELKIIADKIKKDGKGKKYDSILGLSGGFDSSYMLHFAVRELGLRPLVFHVDAGWNEPLAVQNIKKITKKLGVDLKIEKMNWQEMKELQLAFFKAGVPHLDIPQDNAFVAILDKHAKENKIKYVLNGGNISTEVIVNPNSWGYWGTDITHNKDIVKKFCTIPIVEYPFTSVIRRKIVMPYIYGVKVLKLLNYTSYIKADAEKLLMKEYGFIPYEQKHFEDILTKFIEGYWLPKRFGYDVRKPQFSSLILTGQMTRDEAFKKLEKPPLSEKEGEMLFKQVAEMLVISVDELERYFEMPISTYKDYKNSDWLFGIGSKIMFRLKLDKLIRK